MSPASVDVARFVTELLAREGGLCELDPRGAVLALLPERLQLALSLPESSSLRVLGAPLERELPLALESGAMRWCVETARERGRMACARLEGGRMKSQGLGAAATAAVGALNGSLRVAGTRTCSLRVHVLELEYAAIGEERAAGSLTLAIEPTLRAASRPLAECLLARIGEARPIAGDPDPALALREARLHEPYVRKLLQDELAPLRAHLSGRLERDAERMNSYYETLLAEARRPRRGAHAGADPQAKTIAIEKQRAQKLAELAQRSAIEVRLALGSVLVLEYPAQVCDLVLLRRRREIALPIIWDPFLHALLPIPCSACRVPVLTFHACDEAGHLTCPGCARPCASCGRVRCRVCLPDAVCACGAGRG
jgi:hypothetical protein